MGVMIMLQVTVKRITNEILGVKGLTVSMSDQDRISPFIIHTISSRKMMRIEESIN